MEIVIVGGGATGMKAASRARRRDPEAKITVIESSKWLSFSRCGLPYYIEQKVGNLDDLRKTPYGVVRDAEFFKKMKKIEVLEETKALEINRSKKVLKILRRGSEDELNYDFLVLATGAIPSKPPIPGIDSEKVLGLYSPEDADKILRLYRNGAKRAVVIGAGFIGIEACEALKSLGLDVTLIEALDRVAPTMLDSDMARLLASHLKEKGVKILTSTKVEKISGENELIVHAKDKISADFVVVATGVKPNVEIAEKAGIEIGSKGGIVVNERLQTNDPSIYAGGDCIETTNLITNEKVVAPFGDAANKQGRVIGDNITGGNSIYKGVIGTAIFKAFDFSVAVTGLNEETAKRYFNTSSILVSSYDRTHYYPGMGVVRMKLIFDSNSRRILGAQIIGNGVVDKRIEVIATAIMNKMTVDALEDLDLAYAPPYSPALDIVVTASHVVKNKFEGLLNSIKAEEVKNLIESGEDFVLLDVRNEVEAKNIKINIKNTINIPLPKLRERISELPRDKLIITACPLGLRAYEASRILISEGFKNVKVLEGGLPFLLTLI
ncbi:MAG: FAD-dependent oxidoreductase [Archaeoglobales archaeon]|nr:FAD-dependent oxidoreductase [Archaeoglobales archaeon]